MNLDAFTSAVNASPALNPDDKQYLLAKAESLAPERREAIAHILEEAATELDRVLRNRLQQYTDLNSQDGLA
jgi:hypothetical protein